MKVKLKIETQWLELERKSMSKMKRDYEEWERETLKKAKDAKDLRSLREVFYGLGDRWEFDQATGAWLSGGDPLDTVGLILKMPGLEPNKERFVLYAVMAYSKGFTQKFDHLGDKERIIVERDTKTGKLSVWSTTGHGAMDLFPTDLTSFKTIENALKSSYLVAQPGDHALRFETQHSTGLIDFFSKRLWEIAGGNKEFSVKDIDVLTAKDIEESLDFKFNRYAASVISLDEIWRKLSGDTVGKAKEKVLDKIPDHIEAKNKETLRKIEGLLHLLWFRPPAKQIPAIESLHDELFSEPTPTEIQKTLVPYLGELAYSLTDITEKAKYLKWKSVLDQKDFRESDVFKGLDLSPMAKEAFIVALEDILQEHTLAYIGYPERATMKNKVLRVLLGSIILPIRIASSFKAWVTRIVKRILPWPSDKEEEEGIDSHDEEVEVPKAEE
ncbi:MAG: hypothetical protein KGD60_06640 [Candidatus Thorarchaeota archaeon]|nr:hypothetical protein [Candidatus Thorarchaeota archaeon]